MRYGEKYCIIVLYETSMFYKRRNYKYPKAFFNSFAHVILGGHEFKCPAQPLKYLEFQYGADWNKPKQTNRQSEYLSSKLLVNNTLLRLSIFYDKIKLRLYQYLSSIFDDSKLKNRREPLFLFMLSQCISDQKVTFLEVGSSDGEEVEFLLANNLENLTEVILCEPRSDAIQKYRHVTSGFECISIYQCAISTNDGIGDFFVSSNSPNLSSVKKNRNGDHAIPVDLRRLSSIISGHGRMKNLLIKMDIEGAEVDILKDLLPLVHKFDTVTFVFELHQFEYGPSNDLAGVLSKYFASGFEPTYIETAGTRLPKKLKHMKSKIIKTVAGRSLIKVDRNDEILDLVCDNYGEVVWMGTRFSPKLIRSICITNRLHEIKTVA